MRILVQRFRYKQGEMLVGVTDPLPDGTCVSLWVGNWPDTPTRVSAAGHTSIKVCDEYVMDYCAHVDGLIPKGSTTVIRDDFSALDSRDENVVMAWVRDVLIEASETLSGIASRSLVEDVLTAVSQPILGPGEARASIPILAP